VGQQSRGDVWFWLGANDLVDKFAVLEDEHRGNTLNLELRSRPGIFVDIQLGDAITTVGLGSELFHDWSHHATGSAPGRPGVEQDRAGAGVNHVPLKTGIGNY